MKKLLSAILSVSMLIPSAVIPVKAGPPPVVNHIDTYYPVVDTGLMFQNESNKTKPQTYDCFQPQTVDIPIIGSATGAGQTR